MMMESIDERIDAKIGEVRTESIDLSFGEIISLYSQNELIIQPEYGSSVCVMQWTGVIRDGTLI
jgi:hypothetical protein